MIDHRKEIDRLYNLEYGDPTDVAFRGFLAICGAAIHYNYTGLMIAWFWVAGLVACHLAYFTLLRKTPAICSDVDTKRAGTVFLVLLASLMWFPASLITQDDIALRISGTAGTGTLLVYLIHRADRLKWMVKGEIAVMSIMVGGIIGTEMVVVSDTGARLVMVFAGVALMSYFTRTLLQNRRQRLDTEAASVRSVQAQKMEAVGQLAGGVAHDFNNILTAVTGNLELYEVVDDPVEKDQFVAEAHAAAQRAATLVQQLLAYSRKSTLKVANYEVVRIFDHVRALSARLLPSSIRLDFDTTDDQLMVRVDQNQLITALINLIVNARDAMGSAGALVVSARCRSFDEPFTMLDGAVIDAGCYVELAVTDDGPGIPAHILRRVTEPFFTTKEIGEGSGLGLSMVEGFARQSKGGLSIATSSEGTSVRIYLPCPMARSEHAADRATHTAYPAAIQSAA